ncbi:MAG: TonB-dependent receptor [Alistipes sp.]|jgi:TonB-linked SusC/RagA family outer membrane protein|nr:TonB-dependent receptor [Alistipes sp.]
MRKSTLLKSFLVAVSLSLAAVGARAQDLTVTGTVSDGAGAPVAGALVVVEGTSVASVSDGEGNYSIRVPRDGSLTVSFLGYVDQTVAVGGRTRVDIVLETAAEQIDDVVVIGYGTQTKGNLTGSYGIATAEDIKDRPVMFASQMLQGLVPGLNITQTNGAIDQTPSINVRGRGGIATGNNSANGVTNPIVLIDGIEGDINRINPSDIDNVTVLKDAAAASIYGSKAAFGVILITTKRGAQGKTRVNYSNNFRWSTPTKLPETPDSVTFAAYYNDNMVNSGGGMHFSPEWMQAMVDFQAGKFANTIYKNGGTTEGQRWGEGFDPWGVDPNGSDVKIGGFNNIDYYDELFKKYAFAQEHNLSLSGAQGRVNYYTSVNYADQTGLMGFGSDNFDRYSVNARIGYQVLDWIDFTYNVRFNRDIYDRPTDMYNYGDVGRQTWPLLPLYDGNGKLRARLPLRAELGGNEVRRTDNITQRVQMVFEPIDNWRTTLEAAYVTRYEDNHRVGYPTYGGDGGHWDVDGNLIARTTGESSIQNNATFRDQFTLNLFSEYSFKIAEDHNFKVMAGLQEVSEQSKGYGIRKRGVMFEDLPYIGLTSDTNMAGTHVPPTLEGAHLWKTAMYGIFGRINYDYKRRYLFEANLRYDETSRFRAGHRAVWAPSVSAGWNIAEENFMASTRGWINMLKLRASYGTIANQNTQGQYPTYTLMGIGAGGNGGNWWWNGASRPNQASSSGTLENPYMMWSEIVTTDVGFDFALLRDRLTGSFDWFSRRNSDQMGSPLRQPAVIGVSPPYTNSLESKDTGFEISIGWNDRLPNGFSYGVRAMLSDYTTTVLKFPNNPTGAIGTHYPGQKVGNIWGYVTKGMARTQEEMDAHLATTNQDYIDGGGRWGAGDIMYVDLNGNGRIDRGANTLFDTGDRKIIGNDTPRYTFSLDLTAQWKGFDFRAFFQGVGKRDWHASGGNNSFFWGGMGNVWWQNCFTVHLDSWRDKDTWSVDNGYMTENTNNPYFAKPKGGGYNTQVQTRYLQNAAYIRLKNLQIGYTLPTRWTQKASIEQVRVFFSAENLMTITSLLDIYDPETLFGGNNGSIYPLSKVFSFGVNINF